MSMSPDSKSLSTVTEYESLTVVYTGASFLPPGAEAGSSFLTPTCSDMYSCRSYYHVCKNHLYLYLLETAASLCFDTADYSRSDPYPSYM